MPGLAAEFLPCRQSRSDARPDGTPDDREHHEHGGTDRTYWCSAELFRSAQLRNDCAADGRDAAAVVSADSRHQRKPRITSQGRLRGRAVSVRGSASPRRGAPLYDGAGRSGTHPARVGADQNRVTEFSPATDVRDSGIFGERLPGVVKLININSYAGLTRVTCILRRIGLSEKERI